MQIRHIRPAVLEVTLHAYELSALIAAARWAVEGSRGDMPPEALDQLKRVLVGYEEGLQRSHTNSTPERQARSLPDGQATELGRE